jgi:hypothetical protein
LTKSTHFLFGFDDTMYCDNLKFKLCMVGNVKTKSAVADVDVLQIGAGGTMWS